VICLFTWAFEILLLWIGRNGAFYLVHKHGFPLRFLTIMPMDELENFKQHNQSTHITPLDSNVYVHQNTSIVHSNIDGLVFKVERSNSRLENVYDLESLFRSLNQRSLSTKICNLEILVRSVFPFLVI